MFIEIKLTAKNKRYIIPDVNEYRILKCINLKQFGVIIILISKSIIICEGIMFAGG